MVASPLTIEAWRAYASHEMSAEFDYVEGKKLISQGNVSVYFFLKGLVMAKKVHVRKWRHRLLSLERKQQHPGKAAGSAKVPSNLKKPYNANLVIPDGPKMQLVKYSLCSSLFTSMFLTEKHERTP